MTELDQLREENMRLKADLDSLNERYELACQSDNAYRNDCEKLKKAVELLREATKYAEGQLAHTGYTKNAVPTMQNYDKAVKAVLEGK